MAQNIMAMASTVEPPFLVALNLTRRCNLSCAHCYLDAEILKNGSTDELSTQEVKTTIDDIASLGSECMIVLTGGEPLLRSDIEELATHASRLGLMVVVGSNGLTLTRKRVKSLQDAGVAGIGLSIDSLDPQTHDDFRGRKGAWLKTMAGLDACKAEGLAFQIHFSVTDHTAHEIDNMISFARDSGALVLNVFFLVCTGRGEKYTDISVDNYDRVLKRVVEAAREEKQLMIRAKCAPHFKRLAMQLDPEWPITMAHGYEAGGCIAGTRYARVTPQGEMTPCPFIETSGGSVREKSFVEIWNNAEIFHQLRNLKLEGRCGACEYQKLCGGCRARPLARSGNLMAEDFLCSYQPSGGAIIETLAPSQTTLEWSSDAEQRIARVPGFVRSMVKKRVEADVRSRGGKIVTGQDISRLAAERFSDGLPPGLKRPSLK
ncbi:Radical SAM domain heme biosynthesis protein [hydrothermal vent metagenome]|uniref:Radical SAM domain heme biosynthesis protein n=1 Tax=hydrothermal vent metagenome TaxID=652676 RepID=A0A3B0RH14_9ZZZZ